MSSHEEKPGVCFACDQPLQPAYMVQGMAGVDPDGNDITHVHQFCTNWCLIYSLVDGMEKYVRELEKSIDDK